MILSGEVDCDVGNFFISYASRRARAMRGKPATPTEPTTGSLLECHRRQIQARRRARLCFFPEGRPI